MHVPSPGGRAVVGGHGTHAAPTAYARSPQSLQPVGSLKLRRAPSGHGVADGVDVGDGVDDTVCVAVRDGVDVGIAVGDGVDVRDAVGFGVGETSTATMTPELVPANTRAESGSPARQLQSWLAPTVAAHAEPFHTTTPPKNLHAKRRFAESTASTPT